MYLEHFALKELPFRLSPDPAFLYLSAIHSRAKAYMESTIWFTDGFVVITGEIGSGKTTLIETFLKEMQQDVVVAQINQTQISPIEFLQSVLAQWGFNPFKMRKAELIATLNQFLIEQYAAGRKVLLIVDEAQNLTNKVLEEVRLLSGVETTKEKVLRIILAGQPELNAKIDSPDLVQLRQRVRLRFHLSALGEDDLAAYVRHRLNVAGSEGREIFEPETFPVLYKYTGGIPRLINTLCDTALLAAFAQDHPTVSAADLEAAIAELQWTEYAARTMTRAERLSLDDTARHEQPPVGRIEVSHDGQHLSELLLVPGRCVIGRTEDNDLRVDSRVVSRHHAQIVTTMDGSWVEDLNSTNGVFVKGRRVRRHRLKPGDVVRIGQHDLTYHLLAQGATDADDADEEPGEAANEEGAEAAVERDA